MFSLDLGVGGMFLACTGGQSPYYVPNKKNHNYLKDHLLVGEQLRQMLKGRRV